MEPKASGAFTGLLQIKCIFICNVVTSTKEKNEAEGGVRMLGAAVKVVEEGLVKKLTFSKKSGEMKEGAVWVSEGEHFWQVEQ